MGLLGPFGIPDKRTSSYYVVVYKPKDMPERYFACRTKKEADAYWRLLKDLGPEVIEPGAFVQRSRTWDE